jgi:hypothetical protein
MENYVNPEQSGQEQNPQDLLNASLIFARALGLILNEGEGIVVDINGDVSLGDDVNKVIVFKKDEQVHTFKFEEDLPEGTAVSLNPPTEEQTEEVK